MLSELQGLVNHQDATREVVVRNEIGVVEEIVDRIQAGVKGEIGRRIVAIVHQVGGEDGIEDGRVCLQSKVAIVGANACDCVCVVVVEAMRGDEARECGENHEWAAVGINVVCQQAASRSNLQNLVLVDGVGVIRSYGSVEVVGLDIEDRGAVAVDAGDGLKRVVIHIDDARNAVALCVIDVDHCVAMAVKPGLDRNANDVTRAVVADVGASGSIGTAVVKDDDFALVIEEDTDLYIFRGVPVNDFTGEPQDLEGIIGLDPAFYVGTTARNEIESIGTCVMALDLAAGLSQAATREMDVGGILPRNRTAARISPERRRGRSSCGANGGTDPGCNGHDTGRGCLGVKAP